MGKSKIKRKADGSVDRTKARNVAKGYNQEEGVYILCRDLPSKCLLALTPAYPLPNGLSSIALANSLYITWN